MVEVLHGQSTSPFPLVSEEKKESNMAGVLVLMLPLSVLLVVTLGVMAFLDVALRGAQAGSVSSRVGHVTSPGKRLSSTESDSSAWELFSTVRNLAGETSVPPGSKICRFESFVPLVTEPEAKMIAAEVAEFDGELMRKIASKAVRHGESCPMRSDEGSCQCGVARPLACIGRCTQADDSPVWTTNLGESLSEAFRHHLELRQENSVARRLDEALVSILDRPRENAV